MRDPAASAARPPTGFAPPSPGGFIGIEHGAGGAAIADLRPGRPLARITSRGATANYGWRQVIDDGDGTFTDQPLIPDTAWGTATNGPAWELGGREDVPTDGTVIVELVPGQQDGAAWYFRYDGPSAADGPPLTNCRSKFAGWRPTDCLTVSVLEGNDGCDNVAAQAFAAARTDTDYEWVGDEVIPVALGDGVLTIYRDADGDPAAKIEVDTGSAGVVTVVGTYVGCAGDYLEWAFSGTTLCDGTFVSCGDNTFRVRAKCAASCDIALGTVCTVPDVTVPRRLCMSIKWDTAVNSDAGQVADCQPCDIAMEIVYGYWAPAATGTLGEGWYGEAAAPSGCAYPGGIVGADDILRMFLPLGFMGVGGSSTGFAGENNAAFRPKIIGGCGVPASYDPFIMRQSAQVVAPINGCASSSGDNGYTWTVRPVPEGGCAVPTEFSSLCLDGAGEPLDGHPDIEVVMTGGTFAGNHLFEWDAGDGRYEEALSGFGGTLTCAAGVWELAFTDGVTYTGTATAVQPLFLEDPRDFGLTFDAADFPGATSDPTAALA